MHNFKIMKTQSDLSRSESNAFGNGYRRLQLFSLKLILIPALYGLCLSVPSAPEFISLHITNFDFFDKASSHYCVFTVYLL